MIAATFFILHMLKSTSYETKNNKGQQISHKASATETESINKKERWLLCTQYQIKDYVE